MLILLGVYANPIYLPAISLMQPCLVSSFCGASGQVANHPQDMNQVCRWIPHPIIALRVGCMIFFSAQSLKKNVYGHCCVWTL